MTVSIHVAPHPDSLISLVCDQLASPPDDSFASELIAVPTRGIERWMTQQIATELAARGIGDGISANIDFPSPARLVRDVMLAVPDLAVSAAAWQGSTLTAHVVACIDAELSQPWMRMIQRYLETSNGAPSQNRLHAAGKIAGLFSNYGRRRPEMIRAWAAEANTGPDGEPIPDGDRWQPLLWRSLRHRIGVPALPELLPAALEPIRRGEIDVGLPATISVYGLTAVDPSHLDVFTALGEHHDVHLYLLHPSPGLWASTAELLGSQPPQLAPPRNDDPTAALATHPMLVSWARDSRELQYLLGARQLSAPADETAHAGTGTILGRLQDDIHHNRAVTFDRRLAADLTEKGDSSLQIHIGHGARRQVEVARDAILHALADDQTLEPRDVVIMTPDLATFGPLLEASFPGASARAGGGLPDLRVRIADRAPSATNPLVRFAATVLGLADSRLEAEAVRELVARPVVQQRFGFDTDTAGAIVNLIDDAHISWGLNADDRRAWHAGSNEQRTWRRGLDRALVGVFYNDSPVRVVADIAPLDGVEGQEAIPAGLLAAIVDRIVAVREMLRTPMPMSQWGPAIASSVQMLAAPAWREEWQLGQLERLLGETFPDPTPVSPDGGAPDPIITLAEARRAIAGWTEDRPSPLHFRTGDVTACTLAPMRSVPYRVVCLVGMDDERFPRVGRSDGDDLTLTHEIIGDSDRSAQDRQLLLDAVMAAGDHLIITYSGRDELTNAALPPAVPIAELRDTLGDMVGPEAMTQLVTAHPLQSFSEANFKPGELGVPRAWGFDPMQLAGARAVQQRGTALPLVNAVWPTPEPTETIRLADLVTFLQHPAKRFMQTRMGFSIPAASETADDTLPADLNALDKWIVKDRLISGLADGHQLDILTDREQAGDALPPGSLGIDDLEESVAAATELWTAAAERGYDPEQMRPQRGIVPVRVSPVEGTVQANVDRQHLVMLTPSRLKATHRLRAFVELVFLSALKPEISWTALLLGRRKYGNGHLAVSIGPIGEAPDERQELAQGMLADLVDLYVEGHRTPIPLPSETAYAWQSNLDVGRGKAWNEARKTWETDRYSPEAADPAHVMLFPDVASINALLAAGLEDYSDRLWAPILPLSTETTI